MSGRGDNNKQGSSGRGASNQSGQGTPTLHHTHEGSIGNLCTAEIKKEFENGT